MCKLKLPNLYIMGYRLKVAKIKIICFLVVEVNETSLIWKQGNGEK